MSVYRRNLLGRSHQERTVILLIRNLAANPDGPAVLRTLADWSDAERGALRDFVSSTRHLNIPVVREAGFPA